MKLQSKILKYLKPRAYVVNVIAAGDNGSPDILCCYRGRFVGIEVKDAGDRVKKLQSFRKFQIERHKGYSIMAWSVEDVQRLLDVIDEEIDVLNDETF